MHRKLVILSLGLFIFFYSCKKMQCENKVYPDLTIYQQAFLKVSDSTPNFKVTVIDAFLDFVLVNKKMYYKVYKVNPNKFSSDDVISYLFVKGIGFIYLEHTKRSDVFCMILFFLVKG